MRVPHLMDPTIVILSVITSKTLVPFWFWSRNAERTLYRRKPVESIGISSKVRRRTSKGRKIVGDGWTDLHSRNPKSNALVSLPVPRPPRRDWFTINASSFSRRSLRLLRCVYSTRYVDMRNSCTTA